VKSSAIINCKESIILDGEVVVLNKEGKPSSEKLNKAKVKVRDALS
jgi:ATP-dependent DNA ligase